MTMNFETRITQLIDHEFAGSENAAAKEIGIPQPTLNRITSGQRTLPHTSTLLKIAETFGASLDWLVNGTGRGPRCLDLPPRRRTTTWPRASNGTQ